jgi:hypothetical protein
MKRERCWNCTVPIFWGALCVDCVRMTAVTLISAAVGATVAFVVRWLAR